MDFDAERWRQRKKKKEELTPGGIQTHNLLITWCVLYRGALPVAQTCLFCIGMPDYKPILWPLNQAKMIPWG